MGHPAVSGNLERTSPPQGMRASKKPEAASNDYSRGGFLMAASCTHIKDHVKKVKPHTKGCEECLKTGDTWVHLRMCLECGQVGCCDSSKNRHARAHFHSTQHPIIQSAERGEDWKWCYIDDTYI
jgi:uncharacterized UBP type Zn finger protein